ncbi:MAG: alanine dehydrogenase [Zetaproteobacteria bacterium]|nr:alanine dehydrogenase [Pseudobdellovibrionaceae bacterium]|tara:strand:- start:855 stop:1967 length:1113 start_codon:yes stop_codon:yes gene_type:complete
MIIGVPKEIKVRENRVSLVPGGVKSLCSLGHKVFVEKDAGLGAGISNDNFVQSGAQIIASAEEVWGSADMIIKVKEPIVQEYPLLKKDLILYTYLHLAADKKLANVLLEKEVSSIAYETIEFRDGSLPLLKPMSEVAGRMSVQVGAKALEKRNGGKGILLGGVPGVKRSRVVIIGGGVVGINAAKIAVGMGAIVSILDVDQSRLAYLDDIFGNQVNTIMSTPETIEEHVYQSDLVIGAVLVTGNKAPTLVTEKMVEKMEEGSALVDVAIDQGGCIETIKPTTHDKPIYKLHGVNHYGVTNIPGDVPVTSTYALTNVTLGYALKIADLGLEPALASSKPLRFGLNTYKGVTTHPAVGEALGLKYELPQFSS